MERVIGQVVDTRNGIVEPLVMGVVDHTAPVLVSSTCRSFGRRRARSFA